MCTWQRIERLKKTIQCLLHQTEPRFLFIIWNNNPSIRNDIESIIKTEARTLNIRVIHNPTNIGGYGRFYAVRQLLKERKHVPQPILFFDDDQFLKPQAVEIVLKTYRSKSIASRWGWKFNSRENYINRTRAKAGDQVDYCGTNGMIIDASIFDHEITFRCPKKFWFIEDLWLSFVATYYFGWSLRASTIETAITTTIDGKDQFTSTAPYSLKSEFLRYLTNHYAWVLVNFKKNDYVIPINFSSSDYWQKRYITGGTSGAGSEGRLASFKANYINQFLKEEKINSISDFGCGDGRQLSLMNFPKYYGYDISLKSIQICSSLFRTKSNWCFTLMQGKFNPVIITDLSISLDVMFHLIEDKIYSDYLHMLFSSSKKFVIIYSSNYESNENSAIHVRHRKFTKDVINRFPNWRLKNHVLNPFPGQSSNTSFCDFFVFQKIQ